MKQFFFLLIALSLIGSRCHQAPASEPQTEAEPLITMDKLPEPPELFYPIESYEARLTQRHFGERIGGRDAGWYTGDDLEVREEEQHTEVPVYAMADGKVVYRNWLSGYGGILILQHEREGQILQSIYGNLDLAQTVPGLNEFVRGGTLIAFLGDDRSNETDQQRKHLHFALYPGSALKLQTSVANRPDLDTWIDPLAYLKNQQANEPTATMMLPEDWKTINLDTVSPLYPVTLRIPLGWQAAFTPSNESIALTDAETGEIMLFIRYFDAAEFLTLSTVTIHQRSLRQINSYQAVDYDIEKKPWVADFADQPSWRNMRHKVTDIRANDGPSRFFVFAQNPLLDNKTAFYVLQSFMTEVQ